MAFLTRIIRNSSLVLISSSILFSSCSDSTSADESVGEVMSGEKIYLQKCISCHGKNGNLGVSGAADLSKSTLTLEEKIDFISKGSSNGIMQAYGAKFGGPFNDEQLQKLAEHVETLKN